MFGASGAGARPCLFVWFAVVGPLLGAVTTACLPRDADVGRTRPTRDTTAAAKPTATSSAAKPPPVSSAATPPPPDLPLGDEFKDDFERPTLGPNWRITTGRWRIDGGKVCASGARNHPVWLKRRLPTNAIIEFDATSGSPDGDLKAEFWGDGRSGATSASYTNATSYLTIFGGWKNRYHVLARIDEHAKDRPELSLDANTTEVKRKPVEANRSYHFRVERSDGRTVQWSVDGEPILAYPDAEPLVGPGHEHFGFNNWEVPVCFDNLTIKALP
jgi:hypothetical protein